MMKKFRSAIFFASAVFLLPGCSAPMFLTLYNHTGVPLTVHVADRKFEIGINSPLTIKYPGTDVMEIGDGNQVWEYKVIVPPKKYCRPIWAGSTELEIYGQIEPDGLIYALKPNTVLPTRDLPPQPSGYPLRSVRTVTGRQ